MFKNYFKGIEGIDSYPLFLLIVFFAVFVGLTFWLFWKADNKEMQELGEMPLHDSITNDTTQP